MILLKLYLVGNLVDIKPTYHWILNQIKNGEVSGVPSGRKFVAKGGIRLNRASIGFDGTATFMDGGSYAKTCVSGMFLYLAYFGCLHLYVFPSFLLSFLPSFLLSFLSSFFPSFLPSFLPSFIPSFLSYLIIFSIRMSNDSFSIHLDPSLCPHGLSVEMTMKIDPVATMYRAPRYILDSGASSFNSRGIALYTMDNKLRADVAIKDKAYCLAVPLVTDKWQDVVLTYHQDGGRPIIFTISTRKLK